MRRTKRSLMYSVISMVICVAMFIGTTFAWFTDSVTSGVNKIVAGNLDIEVEFSKDGSTWTKLEGSDSVFNKNALWEPGYTEYVYFKVENKGTLAFNYKALVTPVSENGGINVDGESFKLSDYLVFGTTAATEDFDTLEFADRDAARAAVGTTQGLSVDNLTQTGSFLKDGAAQYFALVVYMPETVGNKANYKTGTTAPTIELGIEFKAVQKAYENDSFDDQYDKEAENESKYIAGAYYDYFKAINETATSGSDKKFNVEKDNGNGIVASASGETANAGEDVSLVVTKSSTAETNFTVAVAADHVVNGYDIKVSGQKANSLVQAKLYVGTGLIDFKFYHNNVLMTVGTKGSLTDGQYYYDSAEGYVYFASTTFSPWQATYVAPEAAINGVAYGSLQNALLAAKAGDVVTLLKDIVAKLPTAFGYANQPVYEILTGITLEGNGKTVTASTEEWALYNNKDTGIIFSVGSQNDSTYTTSAVVNVKNLTIIGHENMKHGVSVVKSNNAGTTATFTNVNVKNCGANAFSINGTTATFNNVTTANSGWIVDVDVDKAGNLVINSGIFDYVKKDDEASTITIYGGTYGNDVSAFVANGYSAVKNGDKYEVISSWSLNAAETFSTAVDTTNKVVTIANAKELALFAKDINTYQNYTVKLTADIDLSGKTWTPMGSWNGTFDGQNHTIKGMFVNADKAYGNGFFSYFGNCGTAVMKNITFTDALVQRGAGQYSGNMYGVIAGYAAYYGSVTFENVTVKDSTVWGFGKVGGILGMVEAQGGTIMFTNCAVNNVTIKSGYNGGGIAGLIQKAVSGCYNTVLFDNCTSNVEFVTCGIMRNNAESVKVDELEGLYTVWDSNEYYADTAIFYNEYLTEAEQTDLGVDALVHNTAVNLEPAKN